MTGTLKPITKRMILVLTGLLAAAALTANGETALAAPGSSNITATCVSDGYITVSDGGNVQPQPKYFRLIVVYRTADGWQRQYLRWRPINGSSFRLTAPHGTRYLWAQVATWNGSSYSYEGGWITVENLTISPIGAITERSTRTDGYCRT